MDIILEMELRPCFHVTQLNRGLGLGGWEPSRVCAHSPQEWMSFFLKTLPSRKRPSMANDAEADFYCVIFIVVSSKHSSYHKYSFIFSLPLLFIFIFFVFFYILRFTVALPLIFPCVIMITFCSYYCTLGSPFLIIPVASLGLPSHESLNN